MKRPIEAYFKDQSWKNSKLGRYIALIQWIIILILLFIYVSYISLVITWTLLGAIINPNYFLPYATATLTFISFTATKFKSLKDKIKNGKASILQYFDKAYSGFVNNMLIKMGINLMRIENDVLGKAKETMDNHAFQSTTSKFVEINVLKKEDLETITKKIDELSSINLNNDAIHLANHIASHPETMKKEFDDLTDKIVLFI